MTIPDERPRAWALHRPLGHQHQGSPAVREGQDVPWRSRGYLPHFEGQSVPQALTFRLADSLPKHVLTRIEREIARLPEVLSTAKEANGLPGRTGSFWQREYFDRAIRDVERYRTEIEYIEANPIKAGLCMRIGDWPFSNARLRKIG